jgi:uncharacterized protein (TIGR02145 family)
MKNILYILLGLLICNGCQKDIISQQTMKPNPVFGTVTDIDNNVYKTVTIGEQTFMAENLRTTHLNDSTPIPEVMSNSGWENLSSAAMCWYNNDSTTNNEPYGSLYNWYTVRTEKICPIGWSVPSHYNWEALFTYIGGDSIAGSKLKDVDTLYWKSPNVRATNEWGFDAKGSGWRDYAGEFGSLKTFGFWWCSDESDAIDLQDSRYMTINFNSAAALIGAYPWTAGQSIRCMKNSNE